MLLCGVTQSRAATGRGTGAGRTRSAAGRLPLAARAPPVERPALPLQARPHVPLHEARRADAGASLGVRGHRDEVVLASGAPDDPPVVGGSQGTLRDAGRSDLGDAC